MSPLDEIPETSESDQAIIAILNGFLREFEFQETEAIQGIRRQLNLRPLPEVVHPLMSQFESLMESLADQHRDAQRVRVELTAEIWKAMMLWDLGHTDLALQEISSAADLAYGLGLYTMAAELCQIQGV